MTGSPAGNDVNPGNDTPPNPDAPNDHNSPATTENPPDPVDPAAPVPAPAPAPAPPVNPARYNLIASPDNATCYFVPGGGLSGADELGVFFYFLIIGGNPGDVPALTVTGASDTGLSARYTTSPNNQALSVAQFDVRPGDFGRSHILTISVDAGNQVNETDESDNVIRVSVGLPSPRPTSTVDPLRCSVSRG